MPESYNLNQLAAAIPEARLNRPSRRSYSVADLERMQREEVTAAKWIRERGGNQPGQRNITASRGRRQDRRTIAHATVAISYKLRDRRLYIFPHDIAYYVNAAKRGDITQGEFREIIDWLKACG